MNLAAHIYRSKFTDIDVNTISIELQRECFEFIKTLEKKNQSVIIDDYEYVILSAYELQQFISLQSKTGITYTLEDISDKVLMGEFDLSNNEVYNFCEQYERRFKKLDHVLDKISKYTIENLTKVDKEILQSV